MKKSILLATILIYGATFGQTKVIDSLIQRINNNNAYILLVKTMSPRINSDAGIRIIKIGKDATPELIKVLDNQNKGIIAHFILSKIWKDSWNEEICCAISRNENTEIVVINGLKIYIEKSKLFSKIDDLKNNKEKWQKLLES